MIVPKVQPSASAPSFIRCWGPFRSLQRRWPDSLEHGVEVGLELGAVDPVEAMLPAHSSRTQGLSGGSWSS